MSTFSIRDRKVFIQVEMPYRAVFDLEIGKLTGDKVAVLPSTSWAINRMEQAEDQEMVSDEQLDECREWLLDQDFVVQLPADSDSHLVIELRGGPARWEMKRDETEAAVDDAPTFDDEPPSGRDFDDLDGGDLDFADPGGNSALSAESPSNPRDQPCPTCGCPNCLTLKDVKLHYQCDRCADRAERGFD